MRGRGAVLGLVLGTTSTLVVEGVAGAADGVVAAGSLSMNAPVGIGAVALGVLGLITGLVRRRKVKPEPTAQNRRVEPEPAANRA
ncbi:hypothetical protein GCM10022243_06250 [Saccharothrix violaceirubra]|uniref:Uncharacterized protein n=1 Tax=Saccharothrix violaceirubra TaxID=413306 RepID=A0A7W7SY02_9PSEU|nr:hypothetical protein [Saccharothrix violaceirubra]MBB4963037.1 hypothetical protein [Saccharothrix violaceirubra]